MTKLNVKADGKEIELLSDEEKIFKLYELAEKVAENHKGFITAAKINNKLFDLGEEIDDGDDVEFLDTLNEDGDRVYFRVLSLVFVIACRKIFEKLKLSAEHSISDGLYYTIDIGRELTDEDVEKIKEKMRRIIDNDCVIKKVELDKKEAASIFRVLGKDEKAELIEMRDRGNAKIYECEGYITHFYGMMLPSTGFVKTFDIIKYKKGLVLMGPSMEDKNIPEKFKDAPKLSNIYDESEGWTQSLGVENVRDVNAIIESGQYGDMVRTVEALHEKKISQIADMIKEKGSRVVLIAAPSSSGKTSFAHRLAIQLKVNGLISRPLSIDDYFIERDKTPLDENGEHDFESLKSVDIEVFNRDINKLLNGEEVEIIRYDFKTGKRIHTGEKMSVQKNQILIIEGIHGLNPELTKDIPSDEKFKIYISAITQLNLDPLNRIPTTDLRLIRRIVRDSNFRGYNAADTIKSWRKVRNGEKKNIFPYQEEADVMFNSACVYEISVLKKYAYNLLREVDRSTPEYIEAARLISFMQYFDTLEDTADIPPTSIIREFIGGSKIV